MLFMKIGAALELAGKSQDAIFRERPPYDLQSDWEAIHKSAGNADGRKAAQVAGLHETGYDAFAIRTLRRRFVEWLIGAVGKIESRGSD